MKKIKVFYFKDEPNYEVDAEYIEYSDIIMYKFFYRLLEEIDENTLIVVDDCMRTRNRNDLTYNCLKHYLNQTKHRIIFETFPFIEDKSDIMILADFNAPGKYKGVGFSDDVFDDDIQISPYKLNLSVISCDISDKQREEYQKQKDKLFDNLGNKDPDTIPRALQITAGNFKKSCIDDNCMYIARNKRLNKGNVLSYVDDIQKGEYIVIDTHYQRIHMADFIIKSGMHEVKYISTGLGIDNYIVNDFNDYISRLEEIYAKASLYKKECT